MPEESNVVTATQELPPSRVVVTGDNRAEFMAKKLDIQDVKPEVKAEPEAKAEPEIKAEPEPEEPKTEPEPKKEKTHPIKERMGELANARKEAEAREKAAQERADKAEREAAELRAKLNPPKPQEEATAAPQRANFASDDEYQAAMIDHGVAKALAARDRAAQENSAKAEQEKVATNWKERVTEIQVEIPDYAAKINAATVMVSDAVRDTIIESEVGPRILYHLAEHPEDAERIGKLNVRGAIKEIGKLEAKYAKEEKAAAKAEPKAEPAKPAGNVEISKAPPPINPLKGASAVADNLIDANGNFTGTYQQFKALSKAGKIK